MGTPMIRRLSYLALLLGFAVPVQAQASASGVAPASAKAAFLKLLDRPRVPLDVKAEPAQSGGGLTIERLSFASERKASGDVERVPVRIMHRAKPDGKRPAIIVLHGTGGNKEGMDGWLKDFANRGFLALAIDARYHGERSGGEKGATAYVQAITRAWKTPTGEPHEHPFYYDTCWDLWRTLDYLESREDVDAKRIGMIGFSMGGIETWLAASVDDRVAVSVPAIGVQSFRWSLENGQWQGRAKTIKGAHDAAAKDLGEPEVNAKVCRALWDKVIPGILDTSDCPSLIRLFAGRPLLILNGELDPNCPLGGAELAFAAAEAAFKEADASEKLKINVAKGVGHAVTPEQRKEALDWFVRWLKPSPSAVGG